MGSVGSSLTVANGWTGDVIVEAFVRERVVGEVEVEAALRPQPLAVGGFRSALVARSLGKIIVPCGGTGTFASMVRPVSVSVVPAQGDGYMCDMLQLTPSTNVIVTKRGYVVLARKNKIWFDRSGNDHSVAHNEKFAEAQNQCLTNETISVKTAL